MDWFRCVNICPLETIKTPSWLRLLARCLLVARTDQVVDEESQENSYEESEYTGDGNGHLTVWANA